MYDYGLEPGLESVRVVVTTLTLTISLIPNNIRNANGKWFHSAIN